MLKYQSILTLVMAILGCTGCHKYETLDLIVRSSDGLPARAARLEVAYPFPAYLFEAFPPKRDRAQTDETGQAEIEVAHQRSFGLFVTFEGLTYHLHVNRAEGSSFVESWHTAYSAEKNHVDVLVAARKP